MIPFAQSQIKNTLNETGIDKEKLKSASDRAQQCGFCFSCSGESDHRYFVGRFKRHTDDSADFVVLNVKCIVPEVVSKYGYKDHLERQKISLVLIHVFVFKAIPQRFNFVFHNLLKNALFILRGRLFLDPMAFRLMKLPAVMS